MKLEQLVISSSMEPSSFQFRVLDDVVRICNSSLPVTDFEVFNQGNGEQDIDEWVRLNGEQDM
jgi:hypothetical protein